MKEWRSKTIQGSLLSVIIGFTIGNFIYAAVFEANTTHYNRWKVAGKISFMTTVALVSFYYTNRDRFKS